MVAQHRHHPVARLQLAETAHEVIRLSLSVSGNELTGDGDQIRRRSIDQADYIAEPLWSHPVAHMDVTYLRDAVTAEHGRQTRQCQQNVSNVDPDRLDQRGVAGSGQGRKAGCQSALEKSS